MFRKTAQKIHRSIGVVYVMNPRSTGNHHGYTGRNEHGDPHLHAITEYGEYKVYIITGEIESIYGSPRPNAELRQDASNFLLSHKHELLKMWETQHFYEIKDRK